MKILVLGKSGQVATALQQFNQFCGKKDTPGSLDLEVWGSDVADFMATDSWVGKLRAGNWDVIINTGAYTKVDLAETERVACEQINALSLKAICTELRQSQTLFVHFSTDYVYSGEGQHAWVEDDKAVPLSWYGDTKLRGELIIQENLKNFLIFRTSWVYSPWGSNFVKTMIKLIATRDELKIVSDQIGSPTSALSIARYVFHAIQNFETEKSGIYHLTDDGFASWWDFAVEIEKVALEFGLKPVTKKIIGIPTVEYKTAAIRPLNSRLDKSKVSQTFGLNLVPWQVALREVMGTSEIRSLLENVSNKNI